MERLQGWISSCIFILIINAFFCSSIRADNSSADPVYCHQNECLYCDEDGCFVSSTAENKPVSENKSSVSHIDEVSADQLSQMLSDLETEEPSLKIHQNIALKAKKSIKKQAPMVSKPVTKTSIFHYKPYRPTIDVAQYALHQGNARSANLIEGFIPFYQNSNTVTFTNLRYYNPNGKPMEWNGDLGIRHLFHQPHRLFGIYAGYDRYRSDTGRYFNQAHGGLEYWVNRFFLGGNVYVPFGTKVYDNDAVNSAFLVQTAISYRYNIAYAQGKERVLPGGDAEVGYDMTHGLTVYAGGYYFDHSGVKSIAGPKARATYTFYHRPYKRLLGLFDRIRLEGLVSHDSVRGTSWYAGLRASIALPRQTNPTHGLARHMVDPLRRDLNVIDSNFNNPSQLYQIDGRPARVDLVSATSGRTIDDAVAGTGTSADVIGIIGSQTASAALTIGNRDLTVTGGQYNFTSNGHAYFIPNVGNNGMLTSAGGTANAFYVQDTSGDHTLTLEYFTFNTPDDTGWAVQTDGNSFGQLTVDHIKSNEMPVDVVLTTASATGTVNFTNNALTLKNSTTIDVDAFGLFNGVVFRIADGATELEVASFTDNTINIENRTVDAREVAALYTEAKSATTLINFTKGFLRNTFTASGNGNYGYGWISLGDNTTIAGNMTDNTFTASGNEASGYGWFLYQNNMTLIGNMTGNIFTAAGNEDAGYGWISDDNMTLIGNMTDNTFTASGNGSGGYGWQSFGNMTLGGNMTDNTFTVNNNTGVEYDIGIDVGSGTTVTFSEAVTGNTLMINGSTSGDYGFFLDTSDGGTINFDGNSSQAELSSSNNGTSINENVGTGAINYNG